MAVWTSAYVNSLPDSAFLYVESGSKDGEGKTVPRSKRHLPYKDKNGNIDLPHLRNAIARIPQMKGISQSLKDSLQAKARRLLPKQSSERKEFATPTTQYEIRKHTNGQFCIFDKGAKDPIRGGNGSCHANRADAVSQLRAIYANMGKSFNEKSVLLPTKAFAEVGGDENPKWIQIFPFGHWPHPVYTDTTVNRDTAAAFVKNFKENVRRQEISTDYDHGEDTNKGNKASGWYRDMELRDDGVYALVEWTPTALSEIKAGEWKYFSPMFVDVWEDVETGEIHENVVVGGGLTNRPWMKDMVPINFSEAVLEEETTKYRYKDGKWIVSENNGENWRNASTAEVAELEHAEPGVSSPPPPRLDEDDRSGDKDGSGSRRDSPPPAYENSNSNEEGSMNLSADALKLLGLPENATEEDVDAAITTAFADLPQLKEFAEKNAKKKKFAEEFPEEAERMANLEKVTIEAEAKKFSENYERIVKTEGEGDNVKKTRTTRGFSALALEKIKDMHKSFSEGKAEPKLFAEVLDVITDEKGILDYGETGSARHEELVPDTDEGNARKRLADAATKVQEKALSEGKQMSWGDALSQVGRDDPKLFNEAMGTPAPNET